MMKKIIPILGVTVLILFLIIIVIKVQKHEKGRYGKIEGTVIAKQDELLVFKDMDDFIYKLKANEELDTGDHAILEYTGVLNKNSSNSGVEIVSSTKLVNVQGEDLSKWTDNGIFSKFYTQAYNTLNTLSLDEKIGQLLLARYPEKDINNYNVAGYVFFEKDFKDKTKEQVINMIDSLSKTAKIPLLTAVDEEGGKINRISTNPNLSASPFKGSKEIYDASGLDGIMEDIKNKSKLLSSLHLNVNLAPVVDMSTDTKSYIYDRTIGYGVDITSKYADTVIFASKGSEVSYVLKHFPGYGDNTDTHNGESTDDTPYDEIINNNILPFKAGIEAGAEAVLVSHNKFTSIDATPATLSSAIHNLLRSNLGFTGVIITDDLDMGATKNISDRYVNALLAGNNLLIVTDYDAAFKQIKSGIESGKVTEDYINKVVLRNLAWKYYKLLGFQTNK